MLLLDTHVWLWWLTRKHDKLPLRLIEMLSTASEIVAVSAISCLEVAWLVKKRRIELECSLDEWLSHALAKSGIECLPLLPKIAADSVALPDIHFDPFDRVIIATAQYFDAALISKDEQIRHYPNVRHLWM
jgi:PIN domain nuclease of toxin-antitoxin system